MRNFRNPVCRTPGAFDLAGRIIAYEDGKLEDHEVIELFQYLVNTGLAWQLQGHYGRTAVSLIGSGEVCLPEAE